LEFESGLLEEVTNNIQIISNRKGDRMIRGYCIFH
jgi:hypothetical protein